MKSRSGVSATAIAEGSATGPTPTSDDAAGFERLLTEMLVGLVGAADVDAAIRHGLERVVSLLDADVGVVMESAAEGRGFRVTHAFVRPEHELELAEFPESDFPWLTERLARGEVTRLRRLDELPPEAAEDRRSLARRGVQSAVVCPMRVDGTVSSAVAFASIGRGRDWPDALVERLGLVGQLFAGALARRRTEERLVQEREFAEAVIESLPGMFFMLDEQNRLVRWNKNRELVTGYSAHEFRGRRFSGFFPPEDVPKIQAALEKGWREGSGTSQHHVLTKDGRRIPIIATGRVATIGGRRYVVGMGMDISALEAAEERLTEEREFAAAVLDMLPGLFFALDEHGRLVRWNKNHEVVLGYSADELRGLHFSAYIAPEDVPGAQVAFERTWREGVGAVELHAVTRDARRIPQFAAGGVATIGGRRHVVGLALDISALKVAQDQVRRQQAELAHVARVSAMGELAAAIAHELNQPLTAIRTNAQATRRMLASGAGDAAELDEALVDITADAVRASEIIRRLRDLLRKGDTERAPLDVNDLIREVEPFSRADVLEHSASLRMNLAPRLPRVLGDRIQLQQVVLNLIRNGSEATRDAAVERRELVVSTALSAPHTIEVAVSDSGPPLSDEAFGRMFEPFYTTKAGGLGIGLSLSRSIIEAHGGLLWATRNLPESGITMRFTLPVEPPAAG